jgi:TRAP transporter TAXI family solute receptor
MAWALDANSRNLDSQLSIATSPVGGAYYLMGTGLAKMFSDYTAMESTVYPFEGPDAYISDLNNNNLQLAVISGVNAAWSFRGEDASQVRSDKIRMILRGNIVAHCTMVVRDNSGIAKIADLKGKRYGAGYGANMLTRQLTQAGLASGGLSLKDVKPVPLTELNDSIDAIRLGRVDCGYIGSPTTPNAVQLGKDIDIRIISPADLKPADIANGIPDSLKTVMDEYIPGAVLKVEPAGGVLTEETVLFGYPIDLITNSEVTEDSVYTVLETIWEHYPDLLQASAWAKDWRPETFANTDQPIPYHDGAIKFFKEKGVWTDAMQAKQDALLKL